MSCIYLSWKSTECTIRLNRVYREACEVFTNYKKAIRQNGTWCVYLQLKCWKFNNFKCSCMIFNVILCSLHLSLFHCCYAALLRFVHVRPLFGCVLIYSAVWLSPSFFSLPFRIYSYVSGVFYHHRNVCIGIRVYTNYTQFVPFFAMKL